jgi:peptidoglycan/LPS O-acetylase OafA/YrhL
MNRQITASQRRYELDWLRVIAIFLVFIFHSSRFFDEMDWQVKNPVTYPCVSAPLREIFFKEKSQWN